MSGFSCITLRSTGIRFTAASAAVALFCAMPLATASAFVASPSHFSQGEQASIDTVQYRDGYRRGYRGRYGAGYGRGYGYRGYGNRGYGYRGPGVGAAVGAGIAGAAIGGALAGPRY